MPNKHVRWQDSQLFQSFSDQELGSIQPLCQTIDLAQGETLIHEGDTGNTFYIILSGKLGVYQEGQNYKLSDLYPGQDVGLMSCFDNEPRSATILAEEPSQVASLKLDDIKKLHITHNTELFEQLLLNHIHNNQEKLRNTNQKTVTTLKSQLKAEKLRNVFARVFINIIVTITFYSICMRIIVTTESATQVTTPLTSALVLTFSIIAFLIIRTCPIPLSEFGLTLKNWKAHCKEALVWTAIFLLILTLGKWLMIHMIPAFANDKLIAWPVYTRTGSWTYFFGLTALYASLTSAQEFLFRGTMQTPLMSFLPGRRSTHLAVMLTTFVFTLSHLHLPSIAYAGVVTVPSIFWGYLYARQKSLLGVSLSHAIIGVWATSIMGFPGM